MNTHKQHAILFLFTLLTIAFLSGCSNKKGMGTHELSYDLSQITDLSISYDEENITFYESDTENLVIKEYMSQLDSSYYAKVDSDRQSIHISEGGKPFFKSGFTRYIEVYLPSSYKQNLTIRTTNGTIDVTNTPLHLSSLSIESTSGSVKINEASATILSLSSTRGTFSVGTITADQITIANTKGKTTCDVMDGVVSYTSTSGDLEVASAVGEGVFKANNSGKLHVTYTEVTGNLSFFNKNDAIEVTLPSNLSFTMEATTKNGAVTTDFQENLSVDGRTTQGTIGTNPSTMISLETKNGDINVRKGQ